MAGDLSFGPAVFEEVVDESPGRFRFDEGSSGGFVEADCQDSVGCGGSDSEELP